MSKLTFLSLAEKVLREAKKPLSPSEMWTFAVGRALDQEIQTRGKTPAATLYSAVFTDARDNPNSKFVKLGQRPARYFLKELSTGREIENSPFEGEASTLTVFEYKEAELHRFLAYYSNVHFKAYTKTIKHNTSTRREYGEWVHPDMIGVYFAVEDWKSEVLDLSAVTGNATVTLYSFEIKKTLSFANLREAFFQAVSNSSWANEGFLVAAEISNDEDFLTELRRLSAAFGIGIISLSLDEPDASEILSPAKTKDVVDWDTVNKMTMNKDVVELLKRVKNDLHAKEVIREKYDAILTSEQLIASVSRVHRQ